MSWMSMLSPVMLEALIKAKLPWQMLLSQLSQIFISSLRLLSETPVNDQDSNSPGNHNDRVPGKILSVSYEQYFFLV